MHSCQQNALPEAAQPHFSSTGITSARPWGTRRRLKGVFAEIRYINNLYYEVNYADLQTGEQKVGQTKNNDFYEYRVGGYSGLIDGEGGIITPPIYTDIVGITPTLFKAQLQDWTSMVLIDQKGNVLSKVAR